MATQNNDKPLDISNLITFIVSIICFIADWITISLFIRDLVDEELPFGRGISEISVIVGIFIFGFFLLQHSNLGNKTSLLYWIIAWPYVLISGVLLAIASFKFLWFWNYSLGTYIYYIFIIL